MKIMKLTILTSTAVLFLGTVLNAQVGINTESPKTTLDVDAKRNASGVIIDNSQLIGIQAPRLTRQELTANTATYSTDQKGALVYITDVTGGNTTSPRTNIDTIGYYYFDGLLWQKIGGSGSGSGDTTNDAWVNDNTNTMVKLGTQSDGSTARTPGTDFVAKDNGNVGIGNTPNIYAMLDVSSTNKGLLVPRINLTSSTMDLDSDSDNNVANQPAGLMVFNTGTVLSQGYYFWNGSEWRNFDNSTSVPGNIGALVCSSASLSPSGYNAGTPYTGNLKVPYTGGNGGSYQSGAPITVNGLTFTLRPGQLEFGDGELIFSVTGTPSVSTDFSVIFTPAEIPFITAGQSCTATVANQTTPANVKNIAFAGPLTATTDNGRAGYHFVGTSPDGKWSVRCFLPNATAFADVNLQLRYNGSATDPATIDIISNTAYFWGGVGSTQNNQVRYPKNQWAGYNGSLATLATAVGQTATNFPTWHDPGVYAGGMPEYRYYHWSDFDPTQKVFYTMEFMMASSTPAGTANTTTCPSGVCSTTKVFFNIRQITAPD